MTLRMKAVAVALVVAVAGLAGCAGKEGAAPEKPAIPIPADSPMAKVEAGMTEVDVRKALGEPDDTRSYMTGKAWIPYYYGSDTARTAWTYNGQGVVVFSRNRYTGGLKVVRVDYDPSTGASE